MKSYLNTIFLLFTIIMFTPSAYAQTESNDIKATRIIKGAVIDKNGNPLPGATVTATGGAETVTTDADGTYSIEVPFWLESLTASYPGCKDKKINLSKNDHPIFTLKPFKRTNGSVNTILGGIKGGVTTPFSKHPFLKSMRPVLGLEIGKQLTHTFRFGAESLFGINTSNVRGPHSYTIFDDSYVGAYGAVDLFNLFGVYTSQTRSITIETQAGAGWGHRFETGVNPDQNYFGTKAGLNFNFNVLDNMTINISPFILWDMTSSPVEQSSVSYNVNRANFNLTAGVSYHFRQ